MNAADLVETESAREHRDADGGLLLLEPRLFDVAPQAQAPTRAALRKAKADADGRHHVTGAKLAGDGTMCQGCVNFGATSGIVRIPWVGGLKGKCFAVPVKAATVNRGRPCKPDTPACALFEANPAS